MPIIIIFSVQRATPHSRLVSLYTFLIQSCCILHLILLIRLPFLLQPQHAPQTSVFWKYSKGVLPIRKQTYDSHRPTKEALRKECYDQEPLIHTSRSSLTNHQPKFQEYRARNPLPRLRSNRHSTSTKYYWNQCAYPVIRISLDTLFIDKGYIELKNVIDCCIKATPLDPVPFYDSWSTISHFIPFFCPYIHCICQPVRYTYHGERFQHIQDNYGANHVPFLPRGVHDLWHN